VSANPPLFVLTVSLADGRSTPDDIADALDNVAARMRDEPGGPIDLYTGGVVESLDNVNVGHWEVAHQRAIILNKAALALWGFEMGQASNSWLLTDQEMLALHDRLVADGQIDPEPEGWLADAGDDDDDDEGWFPKGTEDEFNEKYTILQSPSGDTVRPPKQLFRLRVSYRNIWSVMEGDDGSADILPGTHIVNNVGYVVTEQPWQDTRENYVWLEADATNE
jgi:hypothetical protein